MVLDDPSFDKGLPIIRIESGASGTLLGVISVETERRIVEALSQVISPVAAERLLQRAVGKQAKPQNPKAWVDVIEGPLKQELTDVLPVSGLLPSLQALVKELKSQRPDKPTRPALPTLEMAPSTDYVDLEDEHTRRELVRELARWEGVLAVILESVHGRESRLGAYTDSLFTILSVGHWLLERRGKYRVFYTVLQGAQLVIRPVEGGWIGVITRQETNLGQLLYRLGRIEAA